MTPAAIPPTAADAGTYFVGLLVTILPLFALASFLVGLAREYLSPGRIERALERRDEGAGNVAGAGLGAVTPFCSCSSVPLVAGLVQAGTPVGIVFSFLLASPLINEIAVPLLVGLFGLDVAALYVGFTFAAAVIGGVILGRLGLEDHVKDVRSTGGPATATDGGVAARGTAPAASHRVRVGRAAMQAREFFAEVFPYALVGIAAAAVVHGVVPVWWLQAVLGPDNPVAVPLAVLAGVPLYFSLSAMLPVAAALVGKGVPVGTVLALLVGTVGVSLPNLVMLNKLFDRRLLGAYVATVVAMGVAVGLLFNALSL